MSWIKWLKRVWRLTFAHEKIPDKRKVPTGKCEHEVVEIHDIAEALHYYELTGMSFGAYLIDEETVDFYRFLIGGANR